MYENLTVKVESVVAFEVFEEVSEQIFELLGIGFRQEDEDLGRGVCISRLMCKEFGFM